MPMDAVFLKAVAAPAGSRVVQLLAEVIAVLQAKG